MVKYGLYFLFDVPCGLESSARIGILSSGSALDCSGLEILASCRVFRRN